MPTIRVSPWLFLAGSLVAACSGKSQNGGTTAPPPDVTSDPMTRAPALTPDDGLYELAEGVGYKNDCTADSQCFTGGCKGEICSAQNDIVSTCDVIPDWPRGGVACGCVSGQCIWYQGTATPTPTPEPTTGGAAQGQPCPDQKCAAGLTCITYYGIAGPSGPAFTSCEVPCALKSAVCPDGQKCVTIADGPGRVCR